MKAEIDLIVLFCISSVLMAMYRTHTTTRFYAMYSWPFIFRGTLDFGKGVNSLNFFHAQIPLAVTAASAPSSYSTCHQDTRNNVNLLSILHPLICSIGFLRNIIGIQSHVAFLQCVKMASVSFSWVLLRAHHYSAFCVHISALHVHVLSPAPIQSCTVLARHDNHCHTRSNAIQRYTPIPVVQTAPFQTRNI